MASSPAQAQPCETEIGHCPNPENAEIGRPPSPENPPDLVTDGDKDIAISPNLERIVVGVTGRQRFQKIFVRKSSAGGKTTIMYNVDDNAPKAGSLISILPTKAEVESRADTIEFLVVGIVLADFPAKYSTSGTGKARDKKREKERADRGVIPAEKNILRALVPTTDSISSAGVKYYVACNQLFGICNLRLITVDSIFFFDEIWEGVSEKLDAKKRAPALGLSCKTHAARDKRPPQRALVQIANRSSSTPSNVLDVSRVVNAANVLLMQYSIFELSKQPSAIDALKKTVENLLPDLCKKPSDDGILGFYDFSVELTEEDARNAINSVMVCAEMLYIHSSF